MSEVLFRLKILLLGIFVMKVRVLGDDETITQGTTAAFLQEEQHFRRSSDVDVIVKRASNLGSRFNMGKKFGGYSWLRSADSRRRRLEYYLSTKWQRDENLRRLPFLAETWYGSNN